MRGYAYYILGNAAELAIRVGDWDWAQSEVEAAVAATENDLAARMRLAEIRGLRGSDVAEEFKEIANQTAGMTEIQAPASVAEARAVVALAQGKYREALDLARRSYEMTVAPDATAAQTALRAAAWLEDPPAVRHALGAMEGQVGRVPAAIRCEAEAALAALQGQRGEALTTFTDAVRRWRELGLEFEAAVCGLNLVTVLGVAEPEARAAAEHAASVFERLGAKPFAALLAQATRSASPAPGARGSSARTDEAPAAASRAD